MRYFFGCATTVKAILNVPICTRLSHDAYLSQASEQAMYVHVWGYVAMKSRIYFIEWASSITLLPSTTLYNPNVSLLEKYLALKKNIIIIFIFFGFAFLIHATFP